MIIYFHLSSVSSTAWISPHYIMLSSACLAALVKRWNPLNSRIIMFIQLNSADNTSTKWSTPEPIMLAVEKSCAKSRSFGEDEHWNPAEARPLTQANHCSICETDKAGRVTGVSGVESGKGILSSVLLSRRDRWIGCCFSSRRVSAKWRRSSVKENEFQWQKAAL